MFIDKNELKIEYVILNKNVKNTSYTRRSIKITKMNAYKYIFQFNSIIAG